MSANSPTRAAHQARSRHRRPRPLARSLALQVLGGLVVLVAGVLGLNGVILAATTPARVPAGPDSEFTGRNSTSLLPPDPAANPAAPAGAQPPVPLVRSVDSDRVAGERLPVPAQPGTVPTPAATAGGRPGAAPASQRPAAGSAAGGTQPDSAAGNQAGSGGHANDDTSGGPSPNDRSSGASTTTQSQPDQQDSGLLDDVGSTVCSVTDPLLGSSGQSCR